MGESGVHEVVHANTNTNDCCNERVFDGVCVDVFDGARVRGREPKLPPILSVLLWRKLVLLLGELAHSAPWVVEHLTSSLVGGCCIRCREHDVFEKLFSADALEVAQYFVVHVVLDDEHLGGAVFVHTSSGWVGLVRHGRKV